MPPRIAVRDISFFERPIPFAKPFRFGSVVITASRAGLRARRDRDRRQGHFDRRQRRNDGVEMVRQARASVAAADRRRTCVASLAIARELYLARSGFDTAFGHHAAVIAAQVEACAREDIPPLAAGFGPAEIDKAILDALLRGLAIEFLRRHGAEYRRHRCAAVARPRRCRHRAVSRQAASGWSASRSGIPSAWTTRSKARAVSPTSTKMPARAISSSSSTAIPDADAARLIRIGNELATLPHDYSVTLDANEQYADLAALGALVDRLDRDAALKPIAAKAALYRAADAARQFHGSRRSARWRGATSSSTRPTIPTTRSRPRARSAIAASPRNPARASTSRSSTRRAPPNGARTANGSSSPGEDLTCQAGLGVQQDLALGALIGVTHAERNGHHYVDGFADTPAGRGGGVSGGASRSLHPRRQQSPARRSMTAIS